MSARAGINEDKREGALRMAMLYVCLCAGVCVYI